MTYLNKTQKVIVKPTKHPEYKKWTEDVEEEILQFKTNNHLFLGER